MLNSTCFGVILQINHRLMNRTFLMIQPKIKEIILETLQAKVQHQQLSKDQSPVRPKGQNSKCGEEVSGCQSLKYVHGLGRTFPGSSLHTIHTTGFVECPLICFFYSVPPKTHSEKCCSSWSCSPGLGDPRGNFFFH